MGSTAVSVEHLAVGAWQGGIVRNSLWNSRGQGHRHWVSRGHRHLIKSYVLILGSRRVCECVCVCKGDKSWCEILFHHLFNGLPVAQLVKNLPAMWRPGFDPWVRKIPWRSGRLPTPVFWPGEFHGLYSLWRRDELAKSHLFWKMLLFSVPRHWGKSRNATQMAFPRDSGCQDTFVRSWLPLTLLELSWDRKCWFPKGPWNKGQRRWGLELESEHTVMEV